MKKKISFLLVLIMGLFLFGNNVLAEENPHDYNNYSGTPRPHNIICNSEKPFVITYYYGDESLNAEKNYIDDAYEIYTPLTEGMTFEGWYFDKGLTQKLNSAEELKNFENTYEEEHGYNCGGEINLYGKFTLTQSESQVAGECSATGNPYIINYYDWNNKLNAPSEVSTFFEFTNESKLYEPQKDGYLFKTWYLNKRRSFGNGIIVDNKIDDIDELVNNAVQVSEIVAPGQVCQINKRIDLYAKFEKINSEENIGPCNCTIKYAVTYYDGETKLKVDEILNYRDMSVVELYTPSKEGDTFNGWYFDKELTQKLDSPAEIKSKSIAPDGDKCGCNKTLSLYAKWNNKTPNEGATIKEEEPKTPNESTTTKEEEPKTDTKKEEVVEVKDGSSKVVEFKSNKMEIIIPKELSEKIVNVNIKVYNNLEKFEKYKELKKDKFVAYEVDLLNSENVKVQPNGKVQIKFIIPSNLDSSKLIAYRVEEDKLVPYTVKVEGNMAIIEVEHFSTYILAEQTINNPKTGDNMIKLIVIGGILIAGIFVVSKSLILRKN